MTDIRLEDSRVVAEGHSFRIHGEDLEVRSSQRLDALRGVTAASAGPRRALVHGSQDQLILNFGEDYEHTEIVGDVKVGKDLEVGGTMTVDDLLRVRGPIEIQDRGRAALLRFVDRSGKTTMYLSSGIVSANRDVQMHRLRDTSGSRSLLKTIEWLHDRLRVVESRAGIRSSKIREQRG